MKNKLISMIATTSFALSMTCGVLASFEKPTVTPTPPDGLDGNVTMILGIMQWIGFIVGIAMCMWIGIKYITAGAGQKAEVKSTMIPWLVGAALVALAPTIASSIFQQFAKSNNG